MNKPKGAVTKVREARASALPAASEGDHDREIGTASAAGIQVTTAE